MRRIERESRGFVRPGQDLVAAGCAGLEGTRRIAIAGHAGLSRWFSAGFIEDMKREQEPVIGSGSHDWAAMGATEWEEAGEGGIYTALWNISGAYMLGFAIDLTLIPIKQATIEICERLDLNPYRLFSNCMILVTDHGERMVRALKNNGIPAGVIGEVHSGISREVVYGQVRGFMERPREDELYRIIIPKKEDMEYEREDSGVY